MTIPGYGVGIVRIAFGLYMLRQAWQKTGDGWLASGEPLTGAIQRQIENADVFYRPFLTGVVLPNATTFALLVALGEWVVGLSLTVGLLTRLGAAIGIVLAVNYLFLKGTVSILRGDDTWLYVVSFVSFFLGAAGRIWGLDARVGRVPGAWLLTGVDRRVPPIEAREMAARRSDVT